MRYDVFDRNKPERVFGLQVPCRELDIFKIGNCLRNCLEIFWIFSGNFLDYSWGFFGGIFLEEFFGRIFFGGSFLEDLFERIY